MWPLPFFPQLMARHQQELDDLQDKLESDKTRQMLSLRERLAKNRRRRMEDLRRKQDAELTGEMLEQRKELDEVRLKQVCFCVCLCICVCVCVCMHTRKLRSVNG